MSDAEAEALLVQTVAELNRGLQILDGELGKWAKVNSAHGRATIAATLNLLVELVTIQDGLIPKVLAGQSHEPP